MYLRQSNYWKVSYLITVNFHGIKCYLHTNY